ncbi:hypothetical protein HanIR_Chr02g0060771 [Helianthus annuus]|nr:hypothetical protein HanIR_Chr02g0060771 [Helianthus annuus]
MITSTAARHSLTQPPLPAHPPLISVNTSPLCRYSGRSRRHSPAALTAGVHRRRSRHSPAAFTSGVHLRRSWCIHVYIININITQPPQRNLLIRR